MGLAGAITLLAGLPLRGFLLDLAGWSGVVLADACSFLLSGLLLLHIVTPWPPPFPGHARPGSPEHTKASAWDEWMHGLSMVRRSPTLCGLFIASGLGMIAASGFTVLMAPYVREVLRGGAPLLGWLASCQGGGSILGGVALLRLVPGVPALAILTAGLSGTGLLLLVCFNTTLLPVVLVSWILIGALSAATIMGEQSLLQAHTTDATRGRVLGTLATTNALLGRQRSRLGDEKVDKLVELA